MTPKPKISGTREWSVESVNIVLGCSHRCRYCYARANALRRHQIDRPEVWGEEYHRLREKEVRKRRKKVDGTIMFPTTHDITPEFLEPCLAVIHNILAAGDDILIVSKPHLECIKAICFKFLRYRDKILFRFTIGAMNDAILSYWEPGAPLFKERYDSLRHAFEAGYQTSVSCEPMLHSYYVWELFNTLEPFITDTFWIGKMNAIESRVIPGTDPAEIRRIQQGQTNERIRTIHASLKDEPKIRWKESIKQVLGLELATEAGQDV
jgi:DNA repair photolyase